ncbi:MAG: amidohydrolase [Alphaproteobacteria bacterium]|nr:amidohydrolase [Alphaproteobacteria bacterium]
MMTPRWLNSADSHVNEPHDLWEKPLEAKWGDAVPRVIPAEQGVGSNSVTAGGRKYFTGEDYLPIGELVLNDPVLEKVRRTNVDPAFRALCMNEDGVWGELLFPTLAMMVFPLPNADLSRDCLKVYNDWLHDYCRGAPERLFGAALINTENVPLAIAELERNAKRGFRAAMINGDVRPEWAPYRDRRYDPLWARLEEMQIPACIHISTGKKKDIFFFNGSLLGQAATGYLDLMAEAGEVLGNEFIFGGILDRFPRLQLFFVEYEASWLPHWLFRMEQLANDFGPNLGVVKPRRPIREYLNQIHVGVIDDPFVRHVADAIDPARLVWGSDYPHVRNTYGKSHQTVAKIFGHLTTPTIEQITVENSRRLFKIDMPAIS